VDEEKNSELRLPPIVKKRKEMIGIFKRKKDQPEMLITTHNILASVIVILRKAMTALWRLELKYHWISVDDALPKHKNDNEDYIIYSDIVTGYDENHDEVVDCQYTYNGEDGYYRMRGWWERCDELKGDCSIKFWKPKKKNSEDCNS
jgi:hypothetical protein